MPILTPDRIEMLETRFALIWGQINWNASASRSSHEDVEGLHAERRKSSPSPGLHSQFREYKPYEPGDDLKQVDWKRYARTDQIYVKQYESQIRRRFHCFLDLSPSMTFAGFFPADSDPRPGEIPGDKLTLAAELALGMAYLCQQQKDQCQLFGFTITAEGLTQVRSCAPEATLHEMDQTASHWITHHYDHRGDNHQGKPINQDVKAPDSPADLNIIISDCLPPAGRTPAWRLKEMNDKLGIMQAPSLLLHVLHPDEIRLPARLLASRTHLKLDRKSDASHAGVQLSGSPEQIRKRSRKRLKDLMRQCEDWANEHGWRYLPLFHAENRTDPWSRLFEHLH